MKRQCVVERTKAITCNLSTFGSAEQENKSEMTTDKLFFCPENVIRLPTPHSHSEARFSLVKCV